MELEKKNFWKLAILFATIYFVQGTGSPSSGLASQSISYLLKDVMRLTAAGMAFFGSLMSLAWTVKPAYGLISDFVPIFGYRRKSYLILVNLLALISWLILVSFKVYAYWPTLIILMICSLGFAFSDVLCDALMIETGKPLGLTGRLQAIQWGTIMFASVLVGIGGGWVAQHFSYQKVFLLTGLFPLITIIVTLLVVREEKRKTSSSQLRKTWQSVKVGIKSRNLWIVIGFLFFWNFSPSFGAPLFYYEIDVLKFSKIFIGVLSSIGSAASIVGAIIFWNICRNIPIKKLLNLSILIGVISTLAYLGLRDQKTAILLSISLGIISMVSHLTILDLAARTCPKLAEGTIFAGLMSILNLGASASGAVGGWLSNFVSLKWLIIISALFTALCWLIVPYIKVEETNQTQLE